MRPLIFLLMLVTVIQIFQTVQLDAASKPISSIAKKINQSDDVVPNVIIIKFKENYNISENTINTQNPLLDDRLQKSGIFSLKSMFSRQAGGLSKIVSSELSAVYLASFQNGKTPWEMAELVSSWPGVIYAEPKFIHYLFQDIPNDTLYNGNQSAYYEVTEAPEAWAVAKGEEGDVIIAIVDGGTDINHIDLSENIWQNQMEVDGVTDVDDDDNGFVDDYYGWNFANQSGDPTGLPGTPFNADHGTHTAGITSAVTNNTTGVAGMSWNAKVMAINVSDENTDRVIQFGLEGIFYAAENGADIISCSWGRLGGYSYLGQDVVNYAASLGSIVIAAAGNNNSDLSHYPSSYGNVLSIAATDSNDNRYTSTNYGTDVDLAAPGVNIYSTFPDDRYGFATGTSMSAPMTSGAAGIVKTLYPEWSGLQIGEQIRVTVDSLPDEGLQLGRGRLNVFRAVTETSPSVRLVDYYFEDENGNGTIETGETVEIYIAVQNFLEQATNVNLVLKSSDPFVSISQSDIFIPFIGTMDTIQAGTPFVCEIAENTPAAHTVDFIMEIVTNEYRDVEYLSLTILPGYLNLTINNVKMTVTSLGRIINSPLSISQDAVGFTYDFTGNLLYEGAIISGTSELQISDAARVGLDNYDEDFVVTPEGEITRLLNGSYSNEESFGQFVDMDADDPMGIEISQYTYAWEDTFNDDYIFIRFVIRNLNKTDLDNFHFGWFFDWDIDGENFDTNVIQYDADRKMGYAYDVGDGPETYVGVISLSDEEMNFEAINVDELEVFTDAKKWDSISSGLKNETAGPADVAFVIANGPISIPAHSTHRLAFAMVAGDDSVNLFMHADWAIAMWDDLYPLNISSDESLQLPHSYQLFQNYPNPFNPMTIINYELQMTNYVEVNIYNVLGEKVQTLVSESQAAGSHSIEWNATGLASGIYYYELKTAKFRDVNKMILMK